MLRHGPAEAARAAPEPRRGCRHERARRDRPADAAVVGRPIPHESAALHVTGAALYTDDLVAARPACCTPGPVQVEHAHAPGDRLDVAPALEVPGVVRVLTAADVPGVNDAGVKHDEPLFPERGDVPRARPLLGARRDAGGGPARCGGGRVEYEPLPVADHACPRRSTAESFQGTPPHDPPRRPRAGARDGAARLQRRVEIGGPGALLPRDARVARARRLRGAGVRRVAARSTRPRPRRSSPTCSACQPPGHGAVPAHGRRVRRQGDAAARLRRRRRAGRDAHRAARCGCGSTARRTSR